MGNASIEDIIKVAKVKHSGMLEKEFKSAVKSILGTCASIGIFVEDKEPNELIKDVDAGNFDKEIDGKISETSDEKRTSLKEFYEKVKSEQDSKIAEKQKEADEEAKKAGEASAGAEGAGASGEKKEEVKK